MFDACLGIEDGDVVGDSIGDEELFLGGILDHAGGLSGNGPGCDDFEFGGVDDGEGVIPGVGNVEAGTVWRERKAARDCADGNVLDDRIGGCVEHADFFGSLAEDVEARAIGGGKKLKRGGVVRGVGALLVGVDGVVEEGS